MKSSLSEEVVTVNDGHFSLKEYKSMNGPLTNVPAFVGRGEINKLLNATALSGERIKFALFAEAPTVEGLKEEQAILQTESEGIQASADSEGRDLTDEEYEKIGNNLKRIQSLARNITIREGLAANNQGNGPRTRQGGGNNPAPNNTVPRTVPANARPDGEASRFGFKNFGEFAKTVRLAGGPSPEASSQQRLQNALTTFGSEGTGADGGFLVPPDFRREIAEKVLGEQSLLSRTDQQTTTGNSIIFPIDETTPWQTSGGLQVYWEVEAGQKTQSKALFGQNRVDLSKLIALCPVTDELLEDAPALDGYLRRKVPDKMTAKLNTSIMSGTGVGQLKGILNSNSLVTVAKETSQVGDSVIFPNIVKMMSRMYGPSFANAVWLVNNNVIPQLMFMQFQTSAAAPSTPIPVWLPANSASGSPWSTLMGRPVIPMQSSPTVGDLGDIVLADLSQYLTVTKGQQIRTDVSIHIYFDYDVTAFRFVMRVGGQPWWNSTIAPQNGSEDLGFFVALAERT